MSATAILVLALMGSPIMAATNPEITVQVDGLTVRAFIRNPASSSICFLHQPKLQFSFLLRSIHELFYW